MLGVSLFNDLFLKWANGSWPEQFVHCTNIRFMSLQEWLESYDNHILKKWLLRDPQSKDDFILQAYQDIEMRYWYSILPKN